MDTIFYYKNTPTFATDLYNLSGCNKSFKVVFIEPNRRSFRWWHRFYHTLSFPPTKTTCCLSYNVEYIGIQYMNYSIDPFFIDHSHLIESICFREMIIPHKRYPYYVNSTSPILFDIQMPFKPTIQLLRDLEIFSISSNVIDNGLYDLTFVRAIDTQNVASILYILQKHVEAFMSHVPLFVVDAYTSMWFHNYTYQSK